MKKLLKQLSRLLWVLILSLLCAAAYVQLIDKATRNGILSTNLDKIGKYGVLLCLAMLVFGIVVAIIHRLAGSSRKFTAITYFYAWFPLVLLTLCMVLYYFFVIW